MRLRIKLLIVFITGFFIMGIGGGIAFAEFSSFRYGGEKEMGTEMSTVELIRSVPKDAAEIRIDGLDYYRNMGRVRIVEENSLAGNEFKIEVTCDKNRLVPFIEEEQMDEGIYYILNYNYNRSEDVADFFQRKDELLEGMKNRVIYSYTYRESVQDIVIKAPAGLAERIVIGNVSA